MRRALAFTTRAVFSGLLILVPLYLAILLLLFVPSIPTALAGAVYVVNRSRVHPLDVPFTDVLKTVTRWGSGAKELVAAMERAEGVRTLHSP